MCFKPINSNIFETEVQYIILWNTFNNFGRKSFGNDLTSRSIKKEFHWTNEFVRHNER